MFTHRLQAEPHAEGERDVGLELQPGLRGHARNLKGAPHQRDEQGEHAEHAHQSELLGEHGEHEIGVRLGQIEQLLHAAAEADAEPGAAADRDQRLRQLKAAVEGIVPGMQKAGEPLQAIRRGEREHRECRAPPRDTSIST